MLLFRPWLTGAWPQGPSVFCDISTYSTECPLGGVRRREPSWALRQDLWFYALASATPAPNACSFAYAISRRIGAMPQLVEAMMRSSGR